MGDSLDQHRRHDVQQGTVLTVGITRFRTLTQGCISTRRRADEGGTERHTRGDDGHVHEDVEPDLPVEQGLPDVPHLEVLFLADGRVVVLW